MSGKQKEKELKNGSLPVKYRKTDIAHTIKTRKESYRSTKTITLSDMDSDKKIYICLGIGLALLMAAMVFYMYKTNFVQHMFGF